MSKRKLISFDWAMKKLLRSKANFEILEGFLSELLKDSIHILEILESEGNKEDRRDKFNRVDLKVRNQKNEVIIIEVQYDREFDYLQRILFGTSKVLTEYLNEGDPYSKVVKVISINILYFDLGHGKDYVYHGITSFQGLHHQDTLELSENQQALYNTKKIHQIFPEYYLIKVNNFDDIANDTFDEWIYFLKNEEIKENFKAKGLIKAKQELDILKLPEQERLAYEKYQDDLHYQASMVESSYTIGKLKEKRKISVNLLKAGLLDTQTIADMTGLTLEEVEALQREIFPD
ncbi:MAG: Rpn family recombination-promoting nuclease/putative transposase [Candidatus Electrothrix sp. AW5]|nr:Rpn family recombination-promoting nuclease/putative transposase [Candidatus Electrothrix gigas]MCI5195989.1 Rpn family recombination-promoting nuclease/putative transposase [Candidatus Electrothrix gigas]